VDRGPVATRVDRPSPLRSREPASCCLHQRESRSSPSTPTIGDRLATAKFVSIALLRLVDRGILQGPQDRMRAREPRARKLPGPRQPLGHLDPHRLADAPAKKPRSKPTRPLRRDRTYPHATHRPARLRLRPTLAAPQRPPGSVCRRRPGWSSQQSPSRMDRDRSRNGETDPSRDRLDCKERYGGTLDVRVHDHDHDHDHDGCRDPESPLLPRRN
jgi:hypothetical protein